MRAQALIAAATVLTWTAIVASCDTTRACRSGTLLLSIRLGPHAGADSLKVGVIVDGGARKDSSVALRGAANGTVEITFPSGYPSGKTVVVTVSPVQGLVTLATKSTSLTLTDACSSLTIDFGGSDAAADADARAVAGGRGGVSAPGGAGGGAGGDGQTGGAGGLAGTSGGASGGAAGGGTAGQGGGGFAGAGAGGAAASGGRGGNAGMGGTVPGTGGRGSGGASGTGGSPDGGTTDSATDSACTPTAMAESCYNGVDDDCNGMIDCADSACTPVALCEPLNPSTGTVGVSVAADAACPAGTANARTLTAGLAAAACGGCSCQTGTAALICSADIYAYYTESSTCSSNTGGELVTTLDSTQACFTPNWTGLFVYGLRVSTFAAKPTGTCLPAGMPTKGTPVWSSSTKFCAATAVGAGCAAGSVCVPRTVVAAGACLLLEGARTCPAGSPRQTAWFSGYTDTRTCGACACGGPTGGNCGSMIIAVGNDYSCSEEVLKGYLRNGDRLCIGGTGAYSPGLQFTGSAVAPTCAPTVTSTGNLTATGPQTLCCI